MRIFLIVSWLIFISCKSTQQFKISSSKDIGIEWTFSERVNDSFMSKIDSLMRSSITRFNNENHTYKFHPKKSSDLEYATLHFTNGKAVSQKKKANAYLITAAGAVVLPVSMLIADMGFILAFYYFPMNTIDAKVALSPAMTDSIYSYRKLRVQTNGFFKPRVTQTEKLFQKAETKFHALLLDLNNQFEEKTKRGM